MIEWKDIYIYIYGFTIIILQIKIINSLEELMDYGFQNL